MEWIKKWHKRWFEIKEEPDYDWSEHERKFAALKYWTPELIAWISKTNDPMLLSVTSSVLNCHEWPKWLPSKIDKYETMHTEKQEDTHSEQLFFCVELIDMLREKSNRISPGLHQKVWLTHAYRNYSFN